MGKKDVMLDVATGGNHAQTADELSSAMEGYRTPITAPAQIGHIDPSAPVSMLDRRPLRDEKFSIYEGEGESYDVPTGDTPDIPVEEQPAVDTPQAVAGGQGMVPEAPVAEAGPGIPSNPMDEMKDRRQPGQVSVQGPRFDTRNPLSNRDFYGDPGPNLTWQDSTGRSMFIPKAGQLPMGIWSQRMAQNTRQLEETRQRIKELQNPKPPQTADPYQQSFNKMLFTARDSFVGALAEQYDGNEQKAWEEIANDPETNAKFMQMHSDMEAVAQYGKFMWDDAKEVLDDIKAGTLHYTPAMRKEAEDVFYGLGNMRGDEGPAEIRNLVNRLDRFKRSMSRDAYVKEFMMPDLKDRYTKFMETRMYRDPKTGMNVTETSTKESAMEFLRAHARELARQEVYGTEEEILKDLVQRIPPEKLSMTVKAVNPPRPKSSGSGSGSEDKKSRIVRADYRSTSADPLRSSDPNLRSIHLSPFQETGGKEHPVKEINVSVDGSTKTRPMRDAQLVYDPQMGTWSIVGNMLDEGAMERLNTIAESMGFGSPEELRDMDMSQLKTEERNEIMQLWQKRSQRKVADADFNTSILDAHWGDVDPNNILLKQLQDADSDMTYDEVKQALTTRGGRDKIAVELGVLDPNKAAPNRKEAPGIKDDKAQKSSEVATVIMLAPNGDRVKIPADKVDAFKKKFPGASEAK